MSDFADHDFDYRPPDLHWPMYPNSGGRQNWFECTVCKIRVTEYRQHQESEDHLINSRAWWKEYENERAREMFVWK